MEQLELQENDNSLIAIRVFDVVTQNDNPAEEN